MERLKIELQKHFIYYKRAFENAISLILVFINFQI